MNYLCVARRKYILLSWMFVPLIQLNMFRILTYNLRVKHKSNSENNSIFT